MKLKDLLRLSILSLLLSSCGSLFNNSDQNNANNHVHTYSDVWSSDEDYHWHAATCEHSDLVTDKGTHSWDLGVVTKEATVEAEGVKTFTCSICGRTKFETIDKVHVHSFSDEWVSDSTSHWHKCKTCDVESEKEAHSFDAGTVVQPTYEAKGYTEYKCQVCNYSYKANYVNQLEHNFSSEWKYDRSGHWHPCLDAGYEEAVINKANHSYTESVVPPTIEAQGYTIHTCECGYHYEDNYVGLFTVEELQDGTVALSAGSGANSVTDLVIPASYNGKTVSAIKENGFANLPNLKTLRITKSNSLKTIGKEAFKECNALSFAVIPETVTTIGTMAFYHCSESLMIYCEAETKPDGYYYTYSTAGTNWCGTAGINQVWYGMSDYYEDDDYICGVSIYNKISISKYKGSSASIELPSIINELDVETIGTYAFANNKKLTSIKVSQTVTTIEPHAFDECSSLVYAVIPKSVTTIGIMAFYHCSTSLNIYCEAESMPDGYYYTYSTAGDNWFGSAGINQVWYNTIEYIETSDYIFGVLYSGNLKITKYLGKDTEVDIPEYYNEQKITSIGKYAFSGKNRITSVKMHDAMTAIEKYAFDGCSVLEYVVIPSTVTTIESFAFHKCSDHLMIFCEIAIAPEGYYYEYSTAGSNWNAGAKYTWFGMKDYVVTDDYIYGYKVNNSVAVIKYVGNETEVAVPETYDEKRVTEISDCAFQGKNRITSVELPLYITRIGGYAFDGCTLMRSINLDEDYDLSPNSLEIGEYAFQNSGLTTIFLPKHTSYLGNYVFKGTTFTKITYGGNKNRWDDINKGQYWKSGSKITTLAIAGSHEEYSI